MGERKKTWHVAVGVDWADQKHDYSLPNGKSGSFPNTAEGFQKFVQVLREAFPGKTIAICLEQSQGALLYYLLEVEGLVLYPINPAQLAAFRNSLYPSRKIDDVTDAELLRKLLEAHHDQFRPRHPDCAVVRELRTLVRHRRDLVDRRVELVLQLKACLKQYFPSSLKLTDDVTHDLFLTLIRRWPTLQALQRNKPEYLRKFFWKHNCRSNERIEQRIKQIQETQPVVQDRAILDAQSVLARCLCEQIQMLNKQILTYDEKIEKVASKLQETSLFSSIRGVGKQLAPRLVAAFGIDRDRYENAEQVHAYSGIGPVTKQSGKKRVVTRRMACPKFLRQTFHEMAEQMRRYSTWSRAYYDLLRDRGKSHHVALRALAFKWIRILFRMWKTGEHYSEDRYIEQLHRRGSPIVEFLKN